MKLVIPLVLLPVVLAQRPIVDHPVVSEIIDRREEPNGVSNRYFRYGAWNYPHPGKKAKGGEDAWVASHNFIGVADGVGGWEKQGIDASLFSKSLVKSLKQNFD